MQTSSSSSSASIPSAIFPHQQQSSSDIGINSNINEGSGGARYHHREVPPRFQHSKQSKGPRHSSKTNQGKNDLYYVLAQ